MLRQQSFLATVARVQCFHSNRYHSTRGYKTLRASKNFCLVCPDFYLSLNADCFQTASQITTKIWPQTIYSISIFPVKFHKNPWPFFGILLLHLRLFTHHFGALRRISLKIWSNLFQVRIHLHLKFGLDPMRGFLANEDTYTHTYTYTCMAIPCRDPIFRIIMNLVATFIFFRKH